MSEKSTKVIILAAGKGTRMKSSLPKVLHPIFEKPLLKYVDDAVSKITSVKEKFIIVGHQSEIVSEYVSKNIENAKCILQSPQRGTGDAVNKAYNDLENFDGNVLILCGDTPLLTTETLTEFIDFHKTQNSDLTVMSAIFENPFNYGRIVRNENNSVEKIVEEKDANADEKQIKEVNAGVYCINWEKVHQAFNELTCNNAQAEYYLTDIISWAVKKSLNVNAYTIKDNTEIFGINSKIHLEEATRILNQRNLTKLMEQGITIVDRNSTYISCDTEIGADTTILPNVYIEGKNKIGSNCKIGPFARLRGDVEIADNVKIGNFVEIKKTKIDSNTNVCHLSYVGDSELGSHVNIGAGTITANYNHLTKVKSRTIIADNVSTGSNSVIVAPVSIGENATIGAGSVITKDVEKNALALTRSPLKIFANWVIKKLSEK